MDTLPSVDDLRLVRALGITGSVGAAARLMQVSQPSASQRLARLERRLGVALFERDTQGARPTAAGDVMVQRAEHVLGHLESVFDEVRAATHARRLVVGTIPSLAATVLPALVDRLMSSHQVEVEQRVDHGDRLVEWLSEGMLDAVVVAIAEQAVLPRSLVATRLGSEGFILLLPSGVEDIGTGRQPLRGRRVVVSTYDDAIGTLVRRVTAFGATAVRAATVPTALAMARRSTLPAVVPRSTVTHLHEGDRLAELPWRRRLRLTLLTRRDVDPRLLVAASAVAKELGLS